MDRVLPLVDEISARQIAAFRRNCADFKIPFYDFDSKEQGIVHVIPTRARIDTSRNDHRMW